MDLESTVPKKDDLAARAAKLGAARTPASTSSGTRGQVSTQRQTSAATAPRSKPVRVSVDLSPNAYRSLGNYCGEAAAELGRLKVTNVQAFRAFVALLDADPDVRQRVTDELRAQSE